MTPQETIVQKIADKLGTEDFISPGDLVRCGIFGSSTACRNFLRRGTIPSLRISQHRVLIPRDAVIQFLQNSLCAPAK